MSDERKIFKIFLYFIIFFSFGATAPAAGHDLLIPEVST